VRYVELKKFITEDMQMQHIYQPVMLIELLKNGGQATEEEIARFFLNRERVDPHNGLLLEAGLDRLFDEGLITFNRDGEIMMSPQLSIQDRDALGLDPVMRLTCLSERTRFYLEFHRVNMFLRD
jgi:hypothetical protein